jgi:hypothetical protein
MDLKRAMASRHLLPPQTNACGHLGGFAAPTVQGSNPTCLEKKSFFGAHYSRLDCPMGRRSQWTDVAFVLCQERDITMKMVLVRPLKTMLGSQ